MFNGASNAHKAMGVEEVITDEYSLGGAAPANPADRGIIQARARLTGL